MLPEPPIEAHLRALQPVKDRVLRAMQAAGEERGFPIIGPLVGRFCRLLAESMGARRVFEMGSGFGYSTAWFAQAVGPDGLVVHTETDAALGDEARAWLMKAKLADRVRFELGDAVALCAKEPNASFDVVFVDVDKHQYPAAWKVAAKKVRPGGLVLFDNALWGNKVMDPRAKDADTQGVKDLLKAALADKRFLCSVVPMRDGVLVARRAAA